MARLRTGLDTPAGDSSTALDAEAKAELGKRLAAFNKILHACSEDNTTTIKEPENTSASALDAELEALSEHTVTVVLSIPQINKLHKEFQKTIVKGAEIYLQIGKALSEMKEAFGQSFPWKDFVKDNFNFSVRASYGYIKFYERFKNGPGTIAKEAVKSPSGEKELAESPPDAASESTEQEREGDKEEI
jgi:hypothetical protein